MDINGEIGTLGEALIHLHGGVIQRLGEAYLAAARIRIGYRQHIDQKGIDETGIAGRLPRFGGLPDRSCAGDDDRQTGERCRRRAKAMALDELAKAIADAIRMGQYGPSLQMTTQVIGKRLRGFVATRRILVQGARNDSLQIDPDA